MALPRALARAVGRFLNPVVVRRGMTPVLVHVGRHSGRTHKTPLSAFPFDDGYLFTINYGPESDWPKNILASGSATLEQKGETIELTDPRLVPPDEAYALLSSRKGIPPAWVGVEQCLVMSTTDDGTD